MKIRLPALSLHFTKFKTDSSCQSLKNFHTRPSKIKPLTDNPTLYMNIRRSASLHFSISDSAPPPPPRSPATRHCCSGQMDAVLDNKENIPPFSSKESRVDPQTCNHKELMLAGGRPRKPLGDITHLFVRARLARSSSLPEIELSVASRALVLNPRKRRALDDTDLARAARSKSLRKGFR